jgi:hypothetical protein
MLRMVYQSDYPNDKVKLVSDLLLYVSRCFQIPYEERLAEQLATASDNAKLVMKGLKAGTIKPVNQVTDAVPEDTRTVEKRYEDFKKQMEEWGEEVDDFDTWFAAYQLELIQASLFKYPLKKDLFLIWQEAERNAYTDVADVENRQVRCEVSLAAAKVLAPLFEKPETMISEEKYAEVMDAVRATGYFKLAQKAYEEEYHTKESHFRSTGPKLNPVTLEPIPDNRTMDEVWETSVKKIKPKGNA